MSPKIRTLLMPAFVVGFSAIQACSGDARPFEEAIEASQAGLTSLSVEVPEGGLENVILNFGQRITLNLEGGNADNEVFEISGSNRRWVSENPDIASVDEDGTVTGISNGTTTVSVSIADVVSNAFPIEVSNSPLIAIQGVIGATSLDPCVAANYGAIGTFGDGSERNLPSVSFTATPTDTTSVISLSENSASLLATSPGTVVLTAAVDTLTGSSTITVNDSLTDIAISPSVATVTVDGTLQMVASGTFTSGDSFITRDLTESLVWTINSEDETATISNAIGSRGLVSGEAAGSATVTAACGDTSGLATLTVLTSDVEATSLSFEQGLSLNLPLLGGQVSLRVSTGSSFSEDDDVTSSTEFSIVGDTSVVSIGTDADTNGIINPLTIGSTTIRAVFDGRLVAELDVNVTL